MVELVGQAAPQPASFGQDFPAGLFTESEEEFLVLKGTQTGHVVAVVDHNDRHGRAQKLQGACAGPGIEFLAPGAQEVPLQEAVSQQHKDHLMDNQVKGARGEILQIGETLELTMALFNGGAQGIILAGATRVGDRGRIQQYPVLLTAISVKLTVDHGVEGDRTGGEGLQPRHRGHLRTQRRRRIGRGLRLAQAAQVLEFFLHL